MKDDDSISKMKAFTPYSVPSLPTEQGASFTGFANSTVRRGTSTLTVMIGNLNGHRTIAIEYKETEGKYSVGIGWLLTALPRDGGDEEEGSATYASNLFANLHPNTGSDLNIGDQFDLSYSSSAEGQVAGLETGLRLAANKYDHSSSETLGQLGSYYLKVATALSKMERMLPDELLDLKVHSTTAVVIDFDLWACLDAIGEWLHFTALAAAFCAAFETIVLLVLCFIFGGLAAAAAVNMAQKCS